MENEKIVNEKVESPKIESQFSEVSLDKTSVSVEAKEPELKETVLEKEIPPVQQSAELRQVGSATAAPPLPTAASPSGNIASSPAIFVDIPGNTPEEKILHLLNDFPANKAKEIVDGLEELSEVSHGSVLQ